MIFCLFLSFCFVVVVGFVWLHPLLTVVMNPWVRGCRGKDEDGDGGAV